MNLKNRKVYVAILYLVAIDILTVVGAELPVRSAEDIRMLGLRARVFPEERDANVRKLAEGIGSLAENDREQLEELEGDFQDALLLVCDAGVFESLSRETVEAVDDALESAFSDEDILDGEGHEAFIYLYGFFNHDVTAADIMRVRDGWEAIPDDERGPHYPGYVHLIDAVCKPLSMGPLANAEETGRGLEAALPLLKSLLLQPPKRGTAFHPPSHASIVLGPLYDRWEDSEYEELLERELGDRETFVELMTDRLVGGREDRMELEEMHYRFYAYSGRYIANALARLNARESVTALRRSLEVYREKNAGRGDFEYTRRALIALGDEQERERLENEDENEIAEMAAWLCRNGKDETVKYGGRLLGKVLDCAADEALQVYFKRQLEKLRN